jgi:hypothetical protein
MDGFPRKSFLWPAVLLGAGVFLCLFTLAGALSGSDALFATGLALSPWGPICLIVSALLARHVRKVNRLADHGVAARGMVKSIDGTSSSVNGWAVLRIGLTVTVSGQAGYPVTVRNAPPYHLVSMLRPGTSIPVIVDPHRQGQVLIDWKRAEWETSPGGTPPP